MKRLEQSLKGSDKQFIFTSRSTVYLRGEELTTNVLLDPSPLLKKRRTMDGYETR